MPIWGRSPGTKPGYSDSHVKLVCPHPPHRLLAAALVALVIATPSRVLAAPAPKPPQPDSSAYVQISPGLATVVMNEHRFSKDARWGWPWSLGAGGMFTRGPAFKATLGVGLEHRVFFLEDVNLHGLHALLESRIGAGNQRVWGYGLIGLGAASTIVDFGKVSKYGSEVDGFFGVALQYGGGVQVLVGRRFFMGGELDFDLGYFFPNYDRYRLDDFYYHTFSMKLNLGFYFSRPTRRRPRR